MSALIRWLSQQPFSPKHSGYLHPTIACILHYFIVFMTIFTIHDQIVIVLPLLHRNRSNLDNNNNSNIEFHISFSSCTNSSDWVSKVLFYYIIFLYSTRIITTYGIQRKAAIYEFTWLCNTTLSIGAMALYTCRPLIASSFCVAVSIDQVLWYVDLAGYFFSGFQKFPVGVAKYITWPTTSWSTKFTCTHHLWTIPLILYGCSGLHWASFLLSMCIVVCHVLLSRWLTPFTIYHPSVINDKADGGIKGEIQTAVDEQTMKYLNVNLSHELWKDITFPFLQIGYDNPPTSLYLFRLLWRWQVLNLLVFALVLLPLSTLMFGVIST